LAIFWGVADCLILFLISNYVMTKCNTNTAEIGELGCVLGNGLEALFIAIGFFAGLNVILSGIKLATSQGDPKTLASAKARFTWAILGFIIAIGVIAILRLVGGFVGYDLSPGALNLDTNLLR